MLTDKDKELIEYCFDLIKQQRSLIDTMDSKIQELEARKPVEIFIKSKRDDKVVKIFKDQKEEIETLKEENKQLKCQLALHKVEDRARIELIQSRLLNQYA
jgi:hypothetical protein